MSDLAVGGTVVGEASSARPKGEAESRDAPRPPVLVLEEVVALMDAAFLGGGSWFRTADRFASYCSAEGIDLHHESVLAARRALNYYLDPSASHRPSVELRMVDFYLGSEGSPGAVDVSDVDVWRRIASDLAHPAARAHFCDVLFSVAKVDRLENAVNAARSYLEVARVGRFVVEGAEDERVYTWAEHARNLAITRAMSIGHVLANATNGQALLREIHEEGLRRLRNMSESDLMHAGDTLLIARVLISDWSRLGESGRSELIDLLDVNLQKYRGREDIVDGLVALLRVIAPSRRSELDRLRVEVRMESAGAAVAPLNAIRHLESAASLASSLRVKDLHDLAIRKLQRYSVEDLGLETFKTDATIPAEIVRAEIAIASQGARWEDALASWLRTEAPTGRAEQNEESVERAWSGTLLEQLGIPTTVIGPDGLPRWTASSAEERRERHLAMHELMSARIRGGFLADALDLIGQKFDSPTTEDVARFLTDNGRGDLLLAGAMARAITRFWSGDYEGAMVSAAIRVEAGARSLALALDKPAYRTSRADVPGMYVGLPVLMDLLDKHGLDPDWRRFLHTYFVSPAGRHLRHDVAHGFELDVATHRVDAALSIRALGLFVYLVPEPGAAGRCNGHDAALLGPTVTEAITLAYRRARSGISLVELLRAERAALHHARSGTTRLSWRR